jgi:hypothetical protein
MSALPPIAIKRLTRTDVRQVPKAVIEQCLEFLKSVPMLMVHVRRMRMRVFEPAMLMGMGMWLSGAIFGAVLMPVMLVMHVRMRVRHGLVGMGMFVAFR